MASSDSGSRTSSPHGPSYRRGQPSLRRPDFRSRPRKHSSAAARPAAPPHAGAGRRRSGAWPEGGAPADTPTSRPRPVGRRPREKLPSLETAGFCRPAAAARPRWIAALYS